MHRSLSVKSSTPRGSTKKARVGEIRNFTGIDSAYEAPEQPEIHLLNAGKPVEVLVDELMTALRLGNYL